MHDFGVCPSSEERCGLSYESFGLAQLPELISVIQRHRLEGRDADKLLPQLNRFSRFFQEGIFCSDCKAPLIKMARPTAHLGRDTQEYKEITKANKMIEAMYQLQALGKLEV
jgi:hypothetical protein